MRKKIIVASLVALFAVPAFSYADSAPAVFKTDVTDAIARLVSQYEARIAALEAENAALKAQISGTKTAAPSTVPTASSSTMLTVSPLDDEIPSKTAPAKTPTVTAAVSVPAASTGNTEYDAVIKAVNAQLPDILKENGLSETSQLGLFEFVTDKKAFFVSIDDGKNPAGVTAFKTKILFSYGANYQTSVVGVFDLNYDVQKYKTLFGSNPYSAASRVKVKNPAYKGKLLDEVPGATPVVPTSATSSTAASDTSAQTATASSDVTAKSVRAAYDKNKLADAVKLANAYLANNPKDVDILTVRYRSLYITGKYADSLKDVAAIESIQGSKFDCTIAKDAAFIAKSAKDTAAATKYAAIVTACKK